MKHDDRVDVLSAAVSYYEDTLGIDVDEKLAQWEEEEWERLVDTWEDDERRASLILGDKMSGATRLREVNGKPWRGSPRSNNIFGNRDRKW